MTINWKSLRRKYSDIITYRSVSQKKRKNMKNHNPKTKDSLAKLGAYVYADESGHSGKELFGESTHYYQGAIISVGDVESLIENTINKFCKLYKVERLHGFELGEEKVFDVCSDLLEQLEKFEWQFHYTIIEKTYISVTKFVDTFFDSGENPAVPPMWYNIDLFRHKICIEISDLMNREDMQECWKCYLTDDREGLIRFAGEILKKSKSIKDPRTKEVIQESLKYAINNPEIFTLSSRNGRSAYKKQTPNMVAFSSLLTAVHRFCKSNDVGVKSIIHDQTDEFKGTMREYHRMFFGVDFEENKFGGTPLFKNVDYELGTFNLESSKKNYGLQAVDLFLWLVQRDIKNQKINKLKDRLLRKSDEFMISKSRSKLIVEARIQQLNQESLSTEQHKNAMGQFNQMETHRKNRIKA
jgi:hypothetical protein